MKKKFKMFHVSEPESDDKGSIKYHYCMFYISVVQLVAILF